MNGCARTGGCRCILALHLVWAVRVRHCATAETSKEEWLRTLVGAVALWCCIRVLHFRAGGAAVALAQLRRREWLC